MECVGITFLIFAAFIGLMVVLAARAQSRADVWNQAFAAASRRFTGEFSHGGWFSAPQLRFRYGSTYARLGMFSANGKSGPRCLELVVQFPDARVRCEILPKPPAIPLIQEAADLLPLEFDWEDFRHQWRVMADDGDDARSLLSTGVRWQVDQLWQSPERSDVAISIRPGWLLIRKKWSSTRPADIEQFVENSLALYDQAALTRSQGIEFVGDGTIQVIEDAHCRICGESMQSDIVYCKRCKTPHHRECWEYTGICSVYGCREAVYLVPRRAAPKDGSADPDASPLSRPAKPR